MSKNKNVIRVGDKVEIIKPEVYLRTGYPLSTQDIIEKHITQEERELLDKLAATVGYKRFNSDMFGLGSDAEYDKLEYAFARAKLRSMLWGGRERTVHIKEEPDFLNCIGIVHSKKYVKTGTYCDSGSHQGYYDEYPEYEPAYLKNEKTVIIYNVTIHYQGMLSHDREFPQTSIAKISDEDYNEILNKTDKYKLFDWPF